VVRITGKWSIRGRADDARFQYASDIVRTIGRDKPATVRQSTLLRGGQLLLSVGGEQDKMLPPAQFVPGALLPLLVDKLQPGPLLLKSESFLDCEAVGTPEPLTIIIR